MNKYDFDLDVYGENSLTVIISMLKRESQILEVGSAYGRLTKYLNETMHCDVDIIEIDYEAGKVASEFARNACIGGKEGNVEKDYWFEKLENIRYDYIVFADVLEHLYHPENVLKKCKKLLKEDGMIILSIPNIAHNAVILDLMQNEFHYNNIGLLDDTHIRFFTYKSLKRMINLTGFVTIDEKATYKNVEDTEFGISYNMFDKNFTKYLKMRELGNVYQYVFKIKKKEINPDEEFNRTIQLSSEINYEFVCYIKQDGEFSENNTIRNLFRPGNNKFEVDLSKYRDVSEIRIDPIDTSCIVTVQQLCGWKGEEEISLKISSTNGISILNNQYLFTTEDPQINICENLEGLDRMVISFTFNDFDLCKTELYEQLFGQLEFANSEIRRENNDLKSKNYETKKENGVIQEENNELKRKNDVVQGENYVLKRKNDVIQGENNELRAEFEKFKIMFSGSENCNHDLKTEDVNFQDIEKILSNTMNELDSKLRQSEIKYFEKVREYDILVNSKWWRLRSIFKKE